MKSTNDEVYARKIGEPSRIYSRSNVLYNPKRVNYRYNVINI